MAHLIPVRAILAKSRDGAVDDLGVNLPYDIITDAEAIDDTWPEPLKDDVALLSQLHKDDLPLIGLEVELHALLVAIEAEEVGALVPNPGGMPPPVIAAVGILDLEHIRAVIG